LSRIGRDYISIQTEGKNIRLKGGIYEQGNQQSYKETVRERAKSSDREREYGKEHYQRDREELTKLVEKRISYNDKTYQRRSEERPERKSIESDSNIGLRNDRNFSRRLNDTSLSEKSNPQNQNRHLERNSIPGNHEGATNKLTSEPRQKSLLHTNTGELNDRARNKLVEALGKSESINAEINQRSSDISKSSSELGEKSNQFEQLAGRFSETLEKTMIDSRLQDLSSLSIKKKLR